MHKYLFPIFLLFSPLMAQPAIQIHTCYGTPTHLIVEGRVLSERDVEQSSKNDGKIKNLKKKLGELFNDELKDVELTLKLGSYGHTIVSDDEGYFRFEFTAQSPRFYNDSKIKLYAVKEKIEGGCTPAIFDSKPRLGVISDFDDTVIISGVTSKMKLMKNTFFKNYTQREVVTEISEKIRYTVHGELPLFFVTGSPRQLQGAIHQFLDLHHFPKRTVITKKIHGDNSDPLLDQIAYKYEKIKDLILLYPSVKWVMFGDSGEKDREVYTRIQKAYPDRTQAIFIRDVESGKIKLIYPKKGK